MNQRIRLFCLSALLAVGTCGAVRNDPRQSNAAQAPKEGVESKTYNSHNTHNSHDSHPADSIVTYKPVKFDTSGNIGAGHPVDHPYTYEEASSGNYAVSQFTDESFHYGIPPHGIQSHGIQSHGIPAHGINPHKTYYHKYKPQAGKFDLLGDPSYVSPWRKVIKVLTAAIPIGLFIAALPPNILHINSTQTVKPLGLTQKQRSGDAPDMVQTFPVLDMIEKRGGVRALQDADCEANLFCEIARLGKSANANSVQQGFWSVAHDTPDSLAELLGVRELFKAVRTDACQIYKCPTA